MHLNMLDLAAASFADALAKQPDEPAYMRDCAKKLGFHSLYPHASFASARNYLVYSHIAYVFSAGDVLCERIRSARSMKALKNSNMALFNELDKGDFVTRTLALTIWDGMSQQNPNAKAILAEVERIQKLAPFALVDYYRLVRNSELHTAGESDRGTATARDALPAAQVEAQFGAMPSLADNLSSQDALLCSKAWQAVARWLCRYMLNSTDAAAIIRKRFGRLDATRRKVAASKFMELDLLYSGEEVSDALSLLQW